MRPPSSASSAGGGHLSSTQSDHYHASNRQQQYPSPPALPDRFVTGLRCAFQLLDIKGVGKVPYEQVCKKWPIHFAEAPVPSNFLECLRRVIPNEAKMVVTFEHFVKAAQMALQERMSTAGRLKRVQSEGKLLGSEIGSNCEERNRSKSRTPCTTPAASVGHLRANGVHPSMGLSGRGAKLDGRGTGGDVDKQNHRLVRLKRSSRSQPQLNEMFDDAGQQQNQLRTLRRTNWLPENKFNLRFAEKNGSAADTVRDGNEMKILYRSKKNKAPLPPQQSKENRRPISVASTVASAEIVPSSSSTNRATATVFTNSANHLQQQQTMQSNNLCANNYNYNDELQPQVAKHERLLDEECNIVKMGTKKAQELVDWYTGRTESLTKRKRMLNKGMVALDSAIHEQKLNFHRAQIAEMNRRISTFLASSEHGGFPSHNNLNVSSSPATQQNSSPQQQIRRVQMLPPPFTPQQPCHSSVPNSSSNCSSSSSSSAASSALTDSNSNFCNASEAEFLRAQNQKLTRDIQMLALEVEQLRVVERHRTQPPPTAAAVPPYQFQHHQHQQQQQNQKIILNGIIGRHQQQQHNNRVPNNYLMMWNGVPLAPNSNGFPPPFYGPPPKDTLL